MARLEELEKILSDRTALAQAEEASENAEVVLVAELKKLHQAENNVRDQRIKIEQDEFALYSGKMHNPKELQDLQNEVAALKQFLTTLEDRQLEIMMTVEEVESASKAAKNALDQAQAQKVEQNAHF